MALRLPALCGTPTRTEAQQVVNMSIAQQNETTKKLTPLTKQRRDFFSNHEGIEKLGLHHATTILRSFRGPKTGQKFKKYQMHQLFAKKPLDLKSSSKPSHPTLKGLLRKHTNDDSEKFYSKTGQLPRPDLDTPHLTIYQRRISSVCCYAARPPSGSRDRGRATQHLFCRFNPNAGQQHPFNGFFPDRWRFLRYKESRDFHGYKFLSCPSRWIQDNPRNPQYLHHMTLFTPSGGGQVKWV
ncbi:MAG: hypothetical protein H7836_11640 [Magnetococcus sp. YQC-3]